MTTAILAGAFAAATVLFAGLTASGREGDAMAARAGVERRGRVPRLRVHPALLVTPAIALAWPLGIAVAGIPGGIVAIVGVLLAPRIVRRRRAARGARAAEEQLPDAISVLATGVRTGRSLVQALALAGAEVDPPIGPTFRAAADRIALGAPMDDALARWASEVGGPEARVAAGVLRLHQRTGGALPTALQELADTLRARRTGARELRSLTAQARLSAAILGLLPIGFFLFLSAVARRDIEAAYASGLGATAIAVGLGLQAAAFVWIRRLLRVDG